MINSKQAGEWISALAAIDIIGGDDAAKATIISRLTEGALEGRAEVMIQEADIGALDFADLWRGSHRHPGQREKHYIKFAESSDAALLTVPSDFFAARENHWALDPALISWSEGRFVGRCPASFRSPPKRRIVIASAKASARPTPIPHSEALIRRAVSGLRFRKIDIESMAAGRSGVEARAQARTRGKLPSSAKPNDRKHEEYAHSAAEIVRDEGVLPQKAFRRVVVSETMRADDSIIRAIRSAFDLMYDQTGMPRDY